MKRYCLLLWLAISLGAAPVLKTWKWANNDSAFRDFALLLEENSLRNLATRQGAFIAEGNHYKNLIDGDAGVRGADGRVTMSGRGTNVTLYLGKATPVYAVGFYSFNIDARANQDYEVRFALNDAHPGQRPEFPNKPDLTVGDKVIGPNAGGFLSRFENEDKTPLTTKADWVQFRFWQTYNVPAGTPAHSDRPESWTSAIEIEVFGAPDDVIKLPPEILAKRALLKQLPTSYAFVKKPDWEQSLLANRAAIHAWEKQFDDILLEEHGVALGPWEYSKGNDWKALAQLQDGTAVDLANLLEAKPGEVIRLRRNVVLARNFSNGNAFTVNIGFRQGTASLQSGTSCNGTDELRLQPWNANGQAGERLLSVELTVCQDGTAPFYFQPQALGRSKQSAGTQDRRIQLRRNLFGRLRSEFPDAITKTCLDWEETDRIWLTLKELPMAGIRWLPDEWVPGWEPLWVARQYRNTTPKRIAALREALKLHENTIAAQANARLDVLSKELDNPALPLNFVNDQKRYREVMSLTLMLNVIHGLNSARLAIQDQIDTFPESYAEKGTANRQVVERLLASAKALWHEVIEAHEPLIPKVVMFGQHVDAEIHPRLLENPLLGFEKLLFVRGGFYFASNWGGANNLGNEFAVLSPVKPDGTITTLFKPGRIADYDLHFDAQKLLFSNGKHVFEANIDGSEQHQVTRIENPHVKHFDACYLPSGRIVFSSTACEQAVPCTGEWYVANLHVADIDGDHERRICYDQDHDWNPTILNNGRILFTRWEYTDTPHYFSRLLFHANPDGTGQMEYYGSNSYWPNSMFWPRAIPGHPSAISTVVTGHHGTSRVGELYIIDPALSRKNADGVVQQIPGRGKKVEAKIVDNLVDKSWPKFASPYPLAEPVSNRGAGKYFLATMKPDAYSPWGIYLVDIYDNLTPILIGNYIGAQPLRPRVKPPVITSKVLPEATTGRVFMTDVRQGPGIKGYPKGIVKSLRLGTHHYRYGDNGDTYACTYDGGWDVKRIIGTVPVENDGSAFFEVPANVPIFVQPLDKDGKALQTMRSWFVAMPGETVSCIGCHEPQNTASPSMAGLAARKPASPITPWQGPARGFGFEQEVQPVLDRRCVGCHNGQAGRPDFRAKSLRPEIKGNYSPAYNALHPYVRRAGIEADYAMQKPGEWDADTSPLVQLLKKGHHGVRLDPVEWERLYTWIDFNVPFAPNWRQSHKKPSDEQVARRAMFKKQLSNLDDRDEEILPVPAPVAFEPPQTAPSATPAHIELTDWPLTEAAAQTKQKQAASQPLVVDLGQGLTMTFVAIPAGTAILGDNAGAPDEGPARKFELQEPFWLGECEVTNAQYALFDAEHDSAYMDGRFKDRITRGTPVNEPEQPVIRITQRQALAFCEWLSAKTGRHCTLPTEDEWEYACRAGTDTPWNFGVVAEKDQPPVANVNDTSLRRWNWGRIEQAYNDGMMFSAPVKSFAPNRWGLYNMHGNVAEWTLSKYQPDADLITVRGGSWNDLFKNVRSASRWRYPAWQPVYNVGFRVKISFN